MTGWRVKGGMGGGERQKEKRERKEKDVCMYVRMHKLIK
jgi:hypothetical protein